VHFQDSMDVNFPYDDRHKKNDPYGKRASIHLQPRHSVNQCRKDKDAIKNLPI